ncbi:MAG: type II secretion system F family protein [Lachnospiraceae bacterium]|nr:type II secretion system F family protein [Lachnospiraceae bacterium]
MCLRKWPGNKSYGRKKKNLALEILLFSVLLGIVVFLLRFQGIREKVAERDAGLEAEYSTLVTKLTLYLGAGVSIKRAWLSTAAGQWSGKHSYVREEMRLICRELESGVYEDQCYEAFGWRCGRQEYIKLGALLSQNLKKGNSALLQCLRQEAKLAQEQQKHIVRRKGEEASAKLLGPMILLLGMILIVIMVPAFQNIG